MQYILRAYQPIRHDLVICFDGVNLLYGRIVELFNKYPILYDLPDPETRVAKAHQVRYLKIIMEICAVSIHSEIEECLYGCYDDAMALSPVVVPYDATLWNMLIELHDEQARKGGVKNKVLKNEIEQLMTASRVGMDASEFKYLEELYAKNRQVVK